MISLRARLVLWAVGVLAVTLLACGSLVYLTVRSALLDRVDAALAARAQSISLSIVVVAQPPYFLAESLDKTQRIFGSPDFALRVTDDAGRVLIRSASWALGDLRPPVHPLAPGQADPIAPLSASAANNTIRYYLTPLYAGRRLAGYLWVAQPLEAAQQTLSALSRGLFAVGALALCIAAAIMLGLVRRALGPVAAITRTARAIAVSRQPNQRVPYHGSPDEIGQLVATFNAMLSGLDEAQTAQKRFVADASHELRTPLTSILGSAEALARTPDAPAEDRAEALQDIITEARRLSRLVSGLLSLARADGGQQLTREDVDLPALVGEVARRAMAGRPGTAITVVVNQATHVQGDPDRLREVVVILLDNAVKYSPPATPITCTIDQADGYGRLRVRDEGMGISAADLPHIFERFYRAPSARRQDQGGAGLGLPIAAWIVQQHGGRIDAQAADGAGSLITVLLPLPGSLTETLSIS